MSIRYYNRSAPFWDWVANMEEQGRDHPWFSGNQERGEGADNSNDQQQQQHPGAWPGFWPFGNMPHRGRFGPPPPHAHGEDGEHGPNPDAQGPPPAFSGDETEDPPEQAPEDGAEAGPSRRGPPHGRRGGPGRHGHGHGPGHGHGHAWGRGGWGGRGRGGRCGAGRRGFPMGPFGFGGIANMFEDQIFGGNEKSGSDDFKPEVDVFDTPEAFVVHVSLPGAKKEDVGVDWNADKSELSVAGVTYRPGADEEFLKTLALDERKVGPFERKIRLGSRANPAQVDVDGINAKLEDGILRIEVPKLNGGFVEIKKVDVE